MKIDENIHIKNGNYTRIHNRILEELMKIHLSGYEIKIILAIWRKVYGWRKKEDSITFKQFQKMTELPKSEISRTLTRLKKRNLVVEIYNSDRRTYSFNKHFTTWKELEKTTTDVKNYKQSCRKLHKPMEKTTTKSAEDISKNKPSSAPKETLTKETLTKEKTFSLFDFWNSLKIITHKNIKGKVSNRTFKGCLEQALKDNNEETIKEAMQNYKTILEGEEYFWKYRWTIGEFLIRGLDKFLTVNRPFENFRRTNGERKIEIKPEDMKSLAQAKIELGQLSSEDKIFNWLNKLPANLHFELKKHLDRIYPRGHSYENAKERLERS